MNLRQGIPLLNEHKDTHLPSLLGFLDLFEGDTEGPTLPLTSTTHIQHVSQTEKSRYKYKL